MHVIHFGELGTRGTTKEITSAFARKSPALVKTEIEARRAEGFREVADEDERTLLIEYAVEGHGTVSDHDKRARLQTRRTTRSGRTGTTERSCAIVLMAESCGVESEVRTFAFLPSVVSENVRTRC